MKVAFDGRTIDDHYPGIGRYAFGLARALASRAEITLIANLAAVNSRFDLSSLAVQPLPLRARPQSLSAQWLIPRALASTAADVYHSPYYLMPYRLSSVTYQVSRITHHRERPSGQSLWDASRFTFHASRATLHAPRSAPLPSVVTFYDLVPLSPTAGFSALSRLIYRTAHRLAARVSKRIIVLSQAARDSFVTGLGLDSSKIVVIPPGIDLDFHSRPPAEVEKLRARLGLPKTYCLCVGTNKPHKNLVRLIEAYARLPRSAPQLLVAGSEDPRYLQARATVESLGLADRVRFLGSIVEADLPGLYSGATLFVLPSLMEGFGLPIVEAMACGAPVACSNAPGLEEAGGAAAVRFDPADSEAMAETLSRILEDAERREEMRRRGLKHAASFSWERAAEETLKVYEAAIRLR